MRKTFQEFEPLVRTWIAHSSKWWSWTPSFLPQTAAGAAAYLASKSEETPNSNKRITQVVLDLRRGKFRRETAHQRQPETGNKDFMDLRRKINIVEEAMLAALSFDLTVRMPHWILIEAAEKIWRNQEEGKTAEEAASVGWHFINDSCVLASRVFLVWFLQYWGCSSDSFSQPLCLLHRPHLLAAAALALSCAQLSLPLPPPPLSIDEQKTLHDLEAEEGEEPPTFEPEVPWLEVLDVKEDELRGAFLVSFTPASVLPTDVLLIL
jgi:hypothetical protein